MDSIDALFKSGHFFLGKIGVTEGHRSFEKVEKGGDAFLRTSFISWSFTEPIRGEGMWQGENTLFYLHST